MESNITASRLITKEEADAGLMSPDGKSRDPAIVRYSFADEGLVFWLGALIGFAFFMGVMCLLWQFIDWLV